MADIGLVQMGQLLENPTSPLCENDSEQPRTSLYEIAVPGLEIEQYTSFIDFILRARMIYTAGPQGFSVRLGVFNEERWETFQGAWMRIRGNDLYITALNHNTHDLTANGWREITNFRYRDSQLSLSPRAITKALNDSLEWSQNQVFSDEKEELMMRILVFLFSEAARFEVIGRVVYDLINIQEATIWNYFKPILTSWENLSTRLPDPDGRIGVPVSMATSRDFTETTGEYGSYESARTEVIKIHKDFMGENPNQN